MSLDIVYRPITQKDIAGVVELCDGLYNIKRPAQYYTWQWFNCPNKSLLMGAFDVDRLIGLFGMQKKILNNGISCGCAINLNVRPDWQGKGIFSRLGGFIINEFRHCDLFCVFANAKAKYPCEHVFGFRNVATLGTLLLDRFDGEAPADIKVEAINNDFNFTEQQDFRGPVSFVYSSEYRNWRYAQHPFYKYTLLKDNSGDFAIVKKFIDPCTGESFGDIVDFNSPLDNKERLYQIFSRSCGYLKESGVNKITTWALRDSLVRKVVEEIGFKEPGVCSYFEVKIIKPGIEYLYDTNRWHLRQADATNY